MRSLVFSLLLAASLALPSCMMYNPRPAVVVTTPVAVQPRSHWHHPRGYAYGWRPHDNYYMPQGPGYDSPYGYPSHPHHGPRR